MIPNRRRLKGLVLICPSGRELLSHRMPGFERRIFWFVFRSELWEQLGPHSVVRNQPSVGENARQMRVAKYGEPLSTFTICGVKVEADVRYIGVVAQLPTAEDSNQGGWGHTQSATLQSGPLSCDWVPPCAECLIVVIACYSLWISNIIFTCMSLKRRKKNPTGPPKAFFRITDSSQSHLFVFTLWSSSVCSHGLKSITSHCF